MTRSTILLMMTGMLLALGGCRSTSERRPLFCHNHKAPPPKTVYVPPGAPVPIATTPAPRFGPPNPAPTFGPPSGAFPIVPPSGPPPSITPTPADPFKSKFEPNLRPAETREPARDPRIQLYAPEAIDREMPRATEDPPAKKPLIQGAFPPIPQFGVAKENVFAGLHPGRAGLDWLQAKGVKTVVQVRLFGEDDSADRKEVEARGMRYIAFEVSPVVLTKEKADEFIKLVRDGANPGIFVFDADGSLAGGMWYLYLRWGETFDDDTAQLRARGLGLQLDRDGQHRDMWLAVQKVLSENNR